MGNNQQKPLRTVEFTDYVTLLGPVKMTSGHMAALIDSDAPLICADGGAHRALEIGLIPDLIIGDMDSFTCKDAFQDKHSGRIISIPEQDTTDFEKCLYTVKAPAYIGYGFLGGRIDHELATLSTLVSYSQKSVILVGEEDICFCCPKHLEIEVPVGTRVSIYPMSTAKICSDGLKWPLDGLELSPTEQVATSNKTDKQTFSLHIDVGNALVILPYEFLSVVKAALAGG